MTDNKQMGNVLCCNRLCNRSNYSEEERDREGVN